MDESDDEPSLGNDNNDSNNNKSTWVKVPNQDDNQQEQQYDEHVGELHRGGKRRQNESGGTAAQNDDDDNDGGDSEDAELILKKVPFFLRVPRAPLTATGLSIDVFTRATIVMSSLFLGPALLELAQDQVIQQCEHFLSVDNYDTSSTTMNVNNSDGNNETLYNTCLEEAKVYGFKPSSLLSNIAVVGGFFAAAILPPFGAVVDRTPYRKQVGMYSAALLTIIKPIEMLIGPDTWFFIAWLQILSAILFHVHISAIYAYKSSDLSGDADQQTRYNTHFFVILYMSTLIFMVEVLSIAIITRSDTIGAAKIALGLATIYCLVGFTIAWKYFLPNRPALVRLLPGQSLVLSSFHSLWKVSLRIHREIPKLRWLLLAIIFAESGNTAVVTIGTTFMVHNLHMDGKGVGIVLFIVLVFGPIGSKVGEYISLETTTTTSLKICCGTFIFVTSLAALSLTPERSYYVAFFGIGWGLCLGWLHPMFTATFITIRPPGIDAQMMGVYLFCSTAFGWVPSLVFSILNENGIPISLSLASLNLFFIFGLLFLCLMDCTDHNTTTISSNSNTATTTTSTTTTGTTSDGSAGGMVGMVQIVSRKDDSENNDDFTDEDTTTGSTSTTRRTRNFLARAGSNNNDKKKKNRYTSLSLSGTGYVIPDTMTQTTSFDDNHNNTANATTGTIFLPEIT